MATSPQFVNTPNSGASLAACRISTANTNRDGSGTIALLVTGGTNGTRLDRVNVQATSTTTLGMVRFYLVDNAGTPNKRLLFEMQVNAINPSVSIPAFTGEWGRSDGQPLVIIPSGWSVQCSTNNAESFDVIPTVCGDL